MKNESFYDPDNPTSWDMEVEFEFLNLTAEQRELAFRIIREKKIVGLAGLMGLLQRLSGEGFRGNVVSRPLFDPPLIVINSKIEKE